MDTPIRQIRRVIEELLNSGGGVRDNIIIYPYGDIGMQIKDILNKAYKIKEAYIVDNGLCKYNSDIYSSELFDKIDCNKYKVIIATLDPEIHKILFEQVSKYFKPENILYFEANISISPKPTELTEFEKKYKEEIKTKIGKYSYGPICCDHLFIKSIGAFCSFAYGVDVVPNHQMEFISTHRSLSGGNGIEGLDFDYIFYSNQSWYFDSIQPQKELIKRNKRITIGNDVWLGRNVIITNGANIGNGVIAGASAVITKDVPDYAVVGGVPARIIRYRYTPEQIKALNEIAWWDWTDDEIRERFDDFYIPIEDFIKKYLK